MLQFGKSRISFRNKIKRIKLHRKWTPCCSFDDTKRQTCVELWSHWNRIEIDQHEKNSAGSHLNGALKSMLISPSHFYFLILLNEFPFIVLRRAPRWAWNQGHSENEADSCNWNCNKFAHCEVWSIAASLPAQCKRKGDLANAERTSFSLCHRDDWYSAKQYFDWCFRHRVRAAISRGVWHANGRAAGCCISAKDKDLCIQLATTQTANEC